MWEDTAPRKSPQRPVVSGYLVGVAVASIVALELASRAVRDQRGLLASSIATGGSTADFVTEALWIPTAPDARDGNPGGSSPGDRHLSAASSSSGGSPCQHAHGEEDHTSGAFNPVLFYLLAYLASACAQEMMMHLPRNYRVPHSVNLFLLGMLMAQIARWLPDIELGRAIRDFMVVDPHIIFWVLLPAILYEDSSGVNWHVMRKVLPSCILLAIPGVILNALLTGSIIRFTFAPGEWTWDVAFLLGSILSATDPVAVMCALHELQAPDKLSHLVSGESLVNDGSAVVIFHLFWDSARHIRTLTPGYSVGFFARLSLGGPVLGMLVAFAALQWLKRTRTFKVEVLVILAAIYGSFFLAEHPEMKVSGVLAVVVLGFFMAANAHFTRYSDEEHSHHAVLHFLGLLSNEAIFVLAGVVGLRFLAEGDLKGRDWLDLLFLYFIVHFTRAFIIIICLPLLKSWGYGMKWKEAVICIMGGLRGAVSLALALMVEFDTRMEEDTRRRVAFHVSGIVLGTLLINGTFIGTLYRFLDIYGEAEHHDKLLIIALKKADVITRRKINLFEQHWFFHNCIFADIWKMVPNLSEAAELLETHHHERKDFNEKRDQSSIFSKRKSISSNGPLVHSINNRSRSRAWHDVNGVMTQIARKLGNTMNDYETRYMQKIRFRRKKMHKFANVFLPKTMGSGQDEAHHEVVELAIQMAKEELTKEQESEEEVEMLGEDDTEDDDDEIVPIGKWTNGHRAHPQPPARPKLSVERVRDAVEGREDDDDELPTVGTYDASPTSKTLVAEAPHFPAQIKKSFSGTSSAALLSAPIAGMSNGLQGSLLDPERSQTSNFGCSSSRSVGFHPLIELDGVSSKEDKVSYGRHSSNPFIIDGGSMALHEIAARRQAKMIRSDDADDLDEVEGSGHFELPRFDLAAFKMTRFIRRMQKLTDLRKKALTRSIQEHRSRKKLKAVTSESLSVADDFASQKIRAVNVLLLESSTIINTLNAGKPPKPDAANLAVLSPPARAEWRWKEALRRIRWSLRIFEQARAERQKLWSEVKTSQDDQTLKRDNGRKKTAQKWLPRQEEQAKLNCIVKDAQSMVEIYCTVLNATRSAYTHMFEARSLSQRAYRILMDSTEFQEEAIYGELRSLPLDEADMKTLLDPRLRNIAAMNHLEQMSCSFFVAWHYIAHASAQEARTAKRCGKFLPFVSGGWWLLRGDIEMLLAYVLTTESIMEEPILANFEPEVKRPMQKAAECAKATAMYCLMKEAPAMFGLFEHILCAKLIMGAQRLLIKDLVEEGVLNEHDAEYVLKHIVNPTQDALDLWTPSHTQLLMARTGGLRKNQADLGTASMSAAAFTNAVRAMGFGNSGGGVQPGDPTASQSARSLISVPPRGPSYEVLTFGHMDVDAATKPEPEISPPSSPTSPNGCTTPMGSPPVVVVADRHTHSGASLPSAVSDDRGFVY